MHSLVCPPVLLLAALGGACGLEPLVEPHKSNVVTREGSELPDPSVGHEFKATSAENLVHDLQLLCADGCISRSRYSRCGPGDVLAGTAI